MPDGSMMRTNPVQGSQTIGLDEAIRRLEAGDGDGLLQNPDVGRLFLGG